MSKTKYQSEAQFTYKVGERSYPIVSIATCRLCRSKHRARAERLLVEGLRPAAVVEALPSDSGLSRRNIYEHLRRGHVTAQDEVVRRILDERSEQRGAEIVEQADSIVMSLALARLVVERFVDRLLVGEMRPTIRDGLRAAKLLNEYDVHRLESERWHTLAIDNGKAAQRLVLMAEAHLAPAAWSAFLNEADRSGLGAFLPAPRGHDYFARRRQNSES